MVSDTRDDGVTQKAPTIAYWPIADGGLQPESDSDPVFALRDAAYLVRSEPHRHRAGFVRELEQAVWAVNPNLPLASVRTLQEIYAASLARTSFTLVMLAIAGGDGAAARRRRHLRRHLLLGVAAPTREIGIRIALGARIAGGHRPVRPARPGAGGIGVAIGLAAAFAITRLMASLLFEISPVDPLTYGAGLADAVRRGRCWRATCRPCAPPASIR